MSYLRFTPDEYSTLVGLCCEQDLGRRHQPAFQRLLVESLQSVAPALAERIAHLGKTKRHLLYWHFRERLAAPVKTRPQFTPQELQLVVEACISSPFPVRLVRPFKHILIELFQEEWPNLARKLFRLSGQQFVQLYEQAVCKDRKDNA